MPAKKTKTEQINIRADEKTKQRLLEASEKEGRSHTNLALHIIKQWLDQHHPEQPDNTQDNGNG